MKPIFILTLLLLMNCCVSATQTILSDSVYEINDKILVKTKDGAEISAMMVRKKDAVAALPIILQYTIYVNHERDLSSLKLIADNGYVGVIAYTRGKNLSSSEIVPYEYDGRDANDVIDWISKQSWCNGKIGMYGGSYNAFTQWAAAKYAHPALKTIISAAAGGPGMGLPMENNIFINPNYQWAFYVTSNKTLDNDVNDDRERFNTMQNKWWESGAAYRQIDSIDGTPNKWLQRWLQHPGYDKYWQDMVPYKTDFSKINVPVLAIDGYYNDSQLSGLYYLREHAKYNKNAEQYLILGPYGHFGAQIGGEAEVNEYKVDPVSLIDFRAMRFEWFNYILKSGKKPDFLKDKVNYEVMGANQWKHAASLDKISNSSLTFYLSDNLLKDNYQLVENKPNKSGFINQEVDFKERTAMNGGFYPYPIVKPELDKGNGLSFISEPLENATEIAGAFEGQIKASINKKDMDISIAIYELTPNGEYFQLSYYVGRASYAKNREKRLLLKPNKVETIPVSNSRLVVRQMALGSRLVLVLNVIKNSAYQINYGTGNEVSDESIADAKTPLKVKWFNNSYIKIPIQKN